VVNVHVDESKFDEACFGTDGVSEDEDEDEDEGDVIKEQEEDADTLNLVLLLNDERTNGFASMPLSHDSNEFCDKFRALLLFRNNCFALF
jgi:hypothetical protein